jgi:hypothetical protein
MLAYHWSGKQHMANQFKLHFQQSTGPWVNQPKVHSITPKANVLSVRIPAKDLVSPSLSLKGQIFSMKQKVIFMM